MTFAFKKAAKRLSLSRRAVLVSAAVLSMFPGLARSADHGALDLRLKPHTQGGIVVGIEVEEVLHQAPVSRGTPILQMPIVATLAPSSLEDPKTLTVSDAKGPLSLSIQEEPPDPSNFKQDRRWVADRDTQGDLHVHYTGHPRVVTPATRPGPLVDVRTEGAGVYGAMVTLLALPETAWPRRVSLHWVLDELPPGSRAATSIGLADRTMVMRRDELEASFFMAGPLNSLPEDGSGSFVVYWITPPAWDLEGAADWTRKAYEYFSTFWRHTGLPFRIFMRTTARFQGGGGGGFNSFIFGNVEDAPRDPVEARELMAHETSHNFIGHTSGDSTAGGQWYSEGADVYYMNLLTYRAGLMPLDRFALNMNTLVAEYYENPLSHLSNEEVTRQFFSSHDAEVVPYQRGPLYFAVVDARLREISGGRRRVDELVRPMVDSSFNGQGITPDLWKGLLRKALGEAGVKEFEAMMRGDSLDLTADLLGACFRREPKVYRQFRPGYRANTEELGVRKVSRLVADSPAAEAGVRNGDELLDPEPLATDQSRADRPFELHVRRDGQPLIFTFDAWGPRVDGWTYVRTQVPEQDCHL